MTFTPVRKDLGIARSGDYARWSIRLKDRGVYPDLTNYSIVAKARAPDLIVGIAVTVVKPAQVGDDKGVFQLVLTPADLTPARGALDEPWIIDVKFHPTTAGQEQLLQRLYSFRQKPKETE